MKKVNKYLSAITLALEEGQGKDTMVLSTLVQSGGLFAKMVVVTAASTRHLSALAERVLLALKAAGCRRRIVEELSEREWTLIDSGDIIVHIMRAEARARYDLEGLWRFEDAVTSPADTDEKQ
ncbi:MAG: ribosome silencing factor [Candidatus Zeuxoniibacter abyssi]|nr:MAG: ribosome silencing factor [Candidatus Persebacteraceae bacterium AB1(2)]